MLDGRACPGHFVLTLSFRSAVLPFPSQQGGGMKKRTCAIYEFKQPPSFPRANKRQGLRGAPPEDPRARGMPRAPEAHHGPLHEARKCRGVVAASETGEPASRAQLGFGFPSFGPRRTYPLSSAGGPSRLRRTCVGTRSTRSRQERPCDARQARRNRATSAAASSRCVTRSCGQPRSRPTLASALETPLGAERE